MGTGVQIRFGRKNPGQERAVGVLGIVRGRRTRKLSWLRATASQPKFERQPMTGDLVAKVDTALHVGAERILSRPCEIHPPAA